MLPRVKAHARALGDAPPPAALSDCCFAQSPKSPLKQVCPQLAEPKSHIAYDHSRPSWISQGIAYDIRVQHSNCQALGRARAGIFPGVVAARVEYIMAPSKTVTMQPCWV